MITQGEYTPANTFEDCKKVLSLEKLTFQATSFIFQPHIVEHLLHLTDKNGHMGIE